jgi:hypothetical protein
MCTCVHACVHIHTCTHSCTCMCTFLLHVVCLMFVVFPDRLSLLCMCSHEYVRVYTHVYIFFACVHTLHVYTSMYMCTYCLSLSCRRRSVVVIVVCQSPLGGNTLSADETWLCGKRSVYVCVLSLLSLVVVVLRDDDVG